jgi:uncharacterized protein YlzI (FlbEa/FlbD family)
MMREEVRKLWFKDIRRQPVTTIKLLGACGNSLYIDPTEIAVVTERDLFNEFRTEIRLRNGKQYFIYDEVEQVLEAISQTTETQKSFSQHLDDVSEVVASWPQWKRNIFGDQHPRPKPDRQSTAEALATKGKEFPTFLKLKGHVEEAELLTPVMDAYAELVSNLLTDIKQMTPSLRDLFAGLAMASIASTGLNILDGAPRERNMAELTRMSYEIAGAMIKAREVSA